MRTERIGYTDPTIGRAVDYAELAMEQDGRIFTHRQAAAVRVVAKRAIRRMLAQDASPSLQLAAAKLAVRVALADPDEAVSRLA